MDKDYRNYRDAFSGQAMPFAYVDLDRFDTNVQDILARAGDTPICVATKSVRCVSLIKRILETSSQFHALMAFSAREAVFLAGQGFDNILVAYPVWGGAETDGLWDALRAGKQITLMVDAAAQVAHLEALAAKAGVVIPLCIDIDMSTSYPGLHFGVRRSGITTVAAALALWAAIQPCKNVRLDGVMGYEAQIAGLGDRIPGSPLKSAVVRWLKKKSLKEVAARRGAIVVALRDAGCDLRFVNGGGTGSVESTCSEDVVTEVTVGSGFYSPVLFDHYEAFHHLPAAGFAIEITRKPTPDIFTAHGGGYVASGAPGPDRLPQPYLPEGTALLPMEGAGEVQTPVTYTGDEELSFGDPVFLRHCKAGELCERFNTLLLLSEGKVVDEVPTYRGEGQCFL